jgi:putative transport protein
VVTLAVAFAAASATAVGVGRLLGLSYPVIAGTFAGALTNTPALAAASEAAGDATGPTIGYSISYVFGVVGMLLVTAAVLSRRGRDDDAPPPLVNQTVRVERTDRPRVGDLQDHHGSAVTFSRLRHGDADPAPILVAVDEQVLEPGDLVTVIGPQHEVDRVAEELGHPSSHSLVTDRRYLDVRRITLSNRKLVGLTLGALRLQDYGAVVSRVRRGDVDMVASDDMMLLLGDRLRVIAPVSRLPELSRHLGDSERGTSDINAPGLAVGLTLGVLLGLVRVPLPGGGFAIGAAAGTLVTGLVMGRLGRVGPLVTATPRSAASALSTFGMLTFLAYAGTKAGGRFLAAAGSSLGWRIALTGFLLTSLVAGIVAIAGFRVHRLGATRLAGVLAGAQTQPGVLAMANERTGFDTRVALGYALVYPAAMIMKILAAQVIARL